MVTSNCNSKCSGDNHFLGDKYVTEGYLNQRICSVCGSHAIPHLGFPSPCNSASGSHKTKDTLLVYKKGTGEVWGSKNDIPILQYHI